MKICSCLKPSVAAQWPTKYRFVSTWTSHHPATATPHLCPPLLPFQVVLLLPLLFDIPHMCPSPLHSLPVYAGLPTLGPGAFSPELQSLRAHLRSCSHDILCSVGGIVVSIAAFHDILRSLVGVISFFSEPP